jgi:pyrimidine-specific ribonucleoside hydrolase
MPESTQPLDPSRPPRGEAGRSIPVVVDCDPGVDDAAALALAGRSPELDLLAVTTVAGNVAVGLATDNALSVLGALGRGDVPVAAGAAGGLVRNKPEHAAVHGPNGLGGVVLARPAGRASARHAVDVLTELLDGAAERPLTIVAIGPLTNIALLLALRPERARRIERIVVMGGSLGAGNVTPAAEYNAWADPEAAQRVLASGLEVWVAQLQVTSLATLDTPSRRRLAGDSAIGAQLSAMIDGYNEGHDVDPALHDVVAVAAVIDPTLVELRPATVEVNTDLGPRRGETVFTLEGGGEGDRGAGSPLKVVVGLDVERMRELLLSRVSDAAHRSSITGETR